MAESIDKNNETHILSVQAMAQRMRENALKMALSSGSNGSHLGGGLSMIEIMATLYGGVLRIDPRNPEWEDRDRFILSKGHGVLAYYPALAEAGFFPVEELKKFEVNGDFLPGHPVMNLTKGIECSSGSLGMGLSFGVGIALAGKNRERTYHTFVLLGDGECNEGSVWEAAMAAAHFRLSRLVAVVDRNTLQYDGTCVEIMNPGDFKAKWESFGWHVIEVDGHDVAALYSAFQSCVHSAEEKPHIVIAHTIKGKGVSFMENRKEWHHSSLSQAQFDKAMAELRSAQ